MAGMRFRKLRIAFSAFCGLACVLLIVLWVLSYWWSDGASGPISRTKAMGLSSSQGRIRARLLDRVWPNEAGWHFGHHSRTKFEKEADEELRRRGPFVSTFKAPPPPIFGPTIDGAFSVAHWLFVLFFATLGAVAAPFIKWHFGLRTLLVATTLVAIILGLVVYAAS
jgi:hypothetical protein